MSALILPDRFSGQQPQYVAPIDRSGVGSKLRFALLGNQSRELVNNIDRTGTIGTTQIVQTGGTAYLSPSTATTWAKPVSALDPFVSGSFSVNWYGYIRTNVQGILLQSLGSGSGWQFYLAPNAPGSSWLYLYGINSGAARAFAITVPDNSLHSLSVTWDDAAGNVEMFLDGVSIGSTWWIKDGVAQGAVQTFGMYDGSGASTPQKMLAVQGYAGKLSNSEIRWLHDNPYGVFLAPATILAFPAAATAAALAGTPQSVASATGALSTQIVLAGASQAQATSSGALTAQIKLAGTPISVSVASGALTAQIQLSGAALAQAIATAALSTGINISAASVAVASASGMLDTVIKLIASAQSVATATGALTTGGAGSLSSNAQASASATGALTAQIRLNAASVAQALAVAGLSTGINLASGAQSAASASGVITTSIQLTAAAVAQAIATGALTVQSGLSAAAIVQATASGTLLAAAGLPVPTVRKLTIENELRMFTVAGDTRTKIIDIDNRTLSA